MQTRIVFSHIVDTEKPMLVLMGGVHGNEHAGIKAIQEVGKRLSHYDGKIDGSVIALLGNLSAIDKNVRYVDADLNRLWTKEDVYRVTAKPYALLNTEERELRENIRVLLDIQGKRRSDFLFMDLHTTSASGGAFSIANEIDGSVNFAKVLGATVITEVAHVLKGTTLQYFEDAGFPAIGFEAGQHDDPKSVDLMIAGIFVMMKEMNIIDYIPTDIDVEALKHLRVDAPSVVKFKSRHAIQTDDRFVMRPGYSNFQKIDRDEILAEDQNGEIKSPSDGLILMPLYQSKGEDGFFIVDAVEF